jgi:hypothetical protein
LLWSRLLLFLSTRENHALVKFFCQFVCIWHKLLCCSLNLSEQPFTSENQSDGVSCCSLFYVHLYMYNGSPCMPSQKICGNV